MADTKGDNGSYVGNGDGPHRLESSSITTTAKPSSSPPEPPFQGKLEDVPKADRDGVSAVFTKFGQFIHTSQKPHPSQISDASYSVATRKTGIKKDLKYLHAKDLKTILDLAKSKLSGEPYVDDKTMIMERVIQLVAGLPHQSKLREKLTNSLLDELWYSLDHPPLLYVGDKFQYRMADGSWNNPMMPQLGAAGSSYARSCRPGIMPPGALPDPSLIFESVMKRTQYRKNANNVSSVLWYWATIVIHDLFWTDLTDISKNKTSSYLDLSPLYGSNQQMQDSVRTFKDGMLKPDSYADKRLLGAPPAVSVILIMFCRFHNHVAKNLAAINEGGRFTPPPPELEGEKATAAWKKYDNDLFQTARLVTSGLYINIMLVDYVRNIVNLNRSNTTWTLDPRAEMGRDVGTASGAERGTGNMVSAEFNLCYRWHSCISEKDDKWVQEFYHKLFGKSPLDLSTKDMVMGFAKFERSIPEDPGEREFGGFKRNPDGTFKDDDLVGCICDGIEDCAGAFGARNVPESMKPVEILGILQGRKWNMAGLNEFRRHFGLKPYETFEDINSDPEVANSLRHLYEHPDFVELYPGIVAEEAKEPMVPGVGITPTYTISRVVLSDAVCLTRGDRLYTTDYHPRYLTSWGYNEVAYDLNINQGCVFYKLFTRAFPNHFKGDSVYAHYPMCVPSETKKILTNLGRAHHFSYERPSFISNRVEIKTFNGAHHILENPDKYKVIRSEGTSFLMNAGGRRFKPSGHSLFPVDQREQANGVSHTSDRSAHIKDFYSKVTDGLIREKSYKLAGNNFVDIVRDVGNLAPVYFVSRLFNLPLRTPENPRGIYTDQELYVVLAVLFISVFSDIDPTKEFPTKQAAAAVATQLGKLVEQNVRSLTSVGISWLFATWPKRDDPVASCGGDLIKGLSKAGLSGYDITWGQILPAVAASVPNVAEAFAQAVDYFLSPDGSAHVPELHRVANLAASPESDRLMLGYCMEGVRLAGAFSSLREAVVDDVIEEDGREVPVRAGDHVFISSTGAAKDAAHFPEPSRVNPHRPLDSYIHFGIGPHVCLGLDASQSGLTEMFRSVFKLKSVRRAPGDQGELKKAPQPGSFDTYMREDRGAFFPFPCTMKICYDD